jgi:hypothetical protein
MDQGLDAGQIIALAESRKTSRKTSTHGEPAPSRPAVIAWPLGHLGPYRCCRKHRSGQARRDHRSPRAYLRTGFYCDRLRNPGAALSAKKVLDVLHEHASEPFPPAALPAGFSLDLVTKQVLR